MWPHLFKAVQRDKNGAFNDEQKRKGQQSGGNSYPKRLTRVICSIPAFRKTSDSHVRGFGRGESQESSFHIGERCTQSTDYFTPPEDIFSTKRNQRVDQTSQLFGHYYSPLKENSPFCGDIFKKYFPDKQQICTDYSNSIGFRKKRKHSPNLCSFTKDELPPMREKHASVTDSPRILSDLYDSSKLFNFQLNKVNECSTLTQLTYSPLRENSPFCGDVFKKYFPDKQQICTDYSNSIGFRKKRKHSPNLCSFTKDELPPKRQKHASVTDSPKILSDSYDSSKLFNFQLNKVNECSTLTQLTVTSQNLREYSENCSNNRSFSTPTVQNYPYPNYIVKNSKASLPSPFLSPESLQLPHEKTSSPESVFGRTASFKNLMDDDGVESVVQSQYSQKLNKSLCGGIPTCIPMSPFQKNELNYNKTDFFQLQPVHTDPDEEYAKWVDESKRSRSNHLMP